MSGDLKTILKARLRIARAKLFGRNGRVNLKYPIIAALALAFMIGDYIFFKRAITYLHALPLNVGEILLLQLLNTLTLTLFSMLLFSNLITSVSALYMARDLELLISSPIKPMALFALKFTEALVGSSWMLVVFGAPIFFAYGSTLGAGPGYHVLVIVVMTPFITIPAAIGSATIMTLIRFVPVKRTYQILSALGAVFIGGIVIFLRFMRPEKYLKRDVSDEIIINFVETLKTPDYPWLPSSIMTNALKSAALGDWALFRVEFTTLTAIALVLLIGCAFLAQSIYLRGWADSIGLGKSGARLKEKYGYRIARFLTAPIPSEMRAVIIKDMKTFWRAPGQWSQLFMLFALTVVYLFNIKNLPLETLYLTNVVSIANIGLAGIVLAAVGARFVFAATAIEGSSFWIIASAPVSPSRFLWAKFLLYCAPIVGLAMLLIVVSNHFLDVTPFIMKLSTLCAAGLAVALTGMGVGFGAIAPKFDYENPAEIGSSTAAMTYMLASIGLTALIVALIAHPTRAHLLSIFRGFEYDPSAYALEYLLVGAALLSATVAPIIIGARSLTRGEF